MIAVNHDWLFKKASPRENHPKSCSQPAETKNVIWETINTGPNRMINANLRQALVHIMSAPINIQIKSGKGAAMPDREYWACKKTSPHCIRLPWMLHGPLTILGMVEDFQKDHRPRYVATVNVDFITNILSWRLKRTRHTELMHILRQADMVTADGMPLVWAGKWLGAPLKERVPGAHLATLKNGRYPPCCHRV
jgi:hypothetical protein